MLSGTGVGGFPARLSIGLQGAWNMAASGNLGLDSLGLSNLTNNGAVARVAGPVGYAGQFTKAAAQYLSVPDSALLSVGDIDFSLSAWVNLDSKPTQGVFAGKTAGGTAATIEYYLDYLASSDRFRFVVSDGTTLRSVLANGFGAPALGTWYMVTGYHDAVANQIGISVNAVSLNTTAHSTGVRDGAGAFEIGRGFNSNSFCFDGKIGPVRFWKRALRFNEMYYLYNNGKGLNIPTFVPAS